MGTLLQTATRKQNVGGDHDIPGAHMIDDPIIGRVEFTLHDFKGNPLFVRNSHPGVGYQCNVKPISPGDVVHLPLYRARIRINVDVQQTTILTNAPYVVQGQLCP